MMKKHFILFLMLGFGLILAQKSKIDLKSIEKNLESKKSDYSYDKLIFKYQGLPKSLDSIEAQHLYYGRNFQKTISTTDSEFKKLTEAFRDKDMDKCLALGKELYSKDPTNLDILLILLRGYEAKKDVSNFSHHMTQLRTLTDAIKSSGDGKSEKTAYVVNTVGDEYILLNILNIGQDYERHSQASKDAMFDIWQKGEDKLYIKVLYLGF